ncbi:MAG TPA: 7-cyano-7-deazaguanine synthase QueC [Candidatus Methanoperedens sp.]|nr:7-cyano-7-deazaguanine synthase QueC [Candidatus Methanoperedens sp.]
MAAGPAVVLLSGGLDSATTLAVAARDGFEPCCLTFSYGQRHGIEVAASRRVAAACGVRRHLVLEIDLRAIGGSALTADLPVPKSGPRSEAAPGIPATYVPARNTIFLAFALGWAEVLGAGDIFIGVNAVDYSGYPDCRPEFIRAFQHLANLATKAAVADSRPVAIHAPLIDLTKAGIIRLGRELGVDYALTRSCYDPAPDGRASAKPRRRSRQESHAPQARPSGAGS